MNRNLLSHRLSAFALAIGIAAGILSVETKTASAQDITVTTPFAFSVGNQHYPTGTYKFALVSQYVLSISRTDGTGKKLFLVEPQDKGALGIPGGLTFASSQGDRNLEAVYIPGMDTAEKLTGYETARNGARRSTNTLAKGCDQKPAATGQ